MYSEYLEKDLNEIVKEVKKQFRQVDKELDEALTIQDELIEMALAIRMYAMSPDYSDKEARKNIVSVLNYTRKKLGFTAPEWRHKWKKGDRYGHQ